MARSSLSTWMMLLLFLVISKYEAKEYLVGDSESSWLLPLPQAERLNQWASTHHFRIGDSLLWKYDEGSESVLDVKEEHYHNCIKSNPIQSYNEGRAKIVLNRPGSFYFISGAQDHCEQGLKMHVRVLSGNQRYYSHPYPIPSSSPPPVPLPPFPLPFPLPPPPILSPSPRRLN
ncbi:early nodulin-55-2-like [Neltuma alba]|uniref:early nodulin-55-2-like n=1 Tax=Neltuma alba TaxID=207710 RepID=UPI0010A4F918|nr:early nodulin-55-2-like [Prosopis alba]